MDGRLLSDGTEGGKSPTVEEVLGRTLWAEPQIYTRTDTDYN